MSTVRSCCVALFLSSFLFGAECKGLAQSSAENNSLPPPNLAHYRNDKIQRRQQQLPESGAAGARQRTNQRATAASPGRRSAKSRAVRRNAVVVQLGRFTGIQWRGWGTSLAWYANFIGGLPYPKLSILLDALFHQTRGLGFNVVRYNIPGGLNATNSPRLAKLPFQAVKGYRQKEGAPYDWTADANQRRVLQGGLKRGVNIVEMISYSPPWWMTLNGDVSGREGGKPNLSHKYFQAFADYLADVVEHYEKVFHVSISGINPVNEPNSWWWRGDGWQEGCSFDLNGVGWIYNLTRVALDKRGLQKTAIVGTDDWASTSFDALQKSKIVRSLVKRMSFHGYRLPYLLGPYNNDNTSDLARLKIVRNEWGKEVWQSEWGPMRPVDPNATDLQLALAQARSIILCLNKGSVSAFLYWQPLAPSNNYTPGGYSRNYGLVRLNYGYSVPFNPVLTLQYYSQLHFSRAVPPGSLLLHLPPSMHRSVLAVYHPQKRRLAVLLLNQHDWAISIQLSKIPGLSVKLLLKEGLRTYIFRTSKRERYKLVYKGVLAPTFETLPIITLPRSSLTTLFLGFVKVT